MHSIKFVPCRREGIVAWACTVYAMERLNAPRLYRITVEGSGDTHESEDKAEIAHYACKMLGVAPDSKDSREEASERAKRRSAVTQAIVDLL